MHAVTRRSITTRREDGLRVERFEDHTRVHDLETGEAHVLDADEAAIWDAIDGRRDVRSIAFVTGLRPRTVAATLGRLAREGLVEADRGVAERAPTGRFSRSGFDAQRV